jgi:glycosyltransferase involved in cell wall biosynthesis
MGNLSGRRVSLVIPTFNAMASITRAIDSVLVQDGVELEVIVIDGASTDGTADWLHEHASAFAQLVSEPDRGQAHAINKGFDLATGNYFAWLCADDTLEPGALAHLVDALEAHPAAVLATGGCLRRFADGRTVVTSPVADFAERLLHMNTIEQPSTVWRGTAHRSAGRLDERLNYAFDWEFWCRLKAIGPMVAVPRILSCYYFSDTNKTSQGGDAMANEMFEVMRRHGPHGGLLAYVYRFLYLTFDRAGYYDPETRDALPQWRRRVFHLTLRALQMFFGRTLIDSYNWNFASRQARGLGWR